MKACGEWAKILTARARRSPSATGIVKHVRRMWERSDGGDRQSVGLPCWRTGCRTINGSWMVDFPRQVRLWQLPRSTAGHITVRFAPGARS